jgi:hypothetical protein
LNIPTEKPTVVQHTDEIADYAEYEGHEQMEAPEDDFIHYQQKLTEEEELTRAQ